MVPHSRALHWWAHGPAPLGTLRDSQRRPRLQCKAMCRIACIARCAHAWHPNPPCPGLHWTYPADKAAALQRELSELRWVLDAAPARHRACRFSFVHVATHLHAWAAWPAPASPATKRVLPCRELSRAVDEGEALVIDPCAPASSPSSVQLSDRQPSELLPAERASQAAGSMAGSAGSEHVALLIEEGGRRGPDR